MPPDGPAAGESIDLSFLQGTEYLVDPMQTNAVNQFSDLDMQYW